MKVNTVSHKLLFSLFLVLNSMLLPVFTGCEDDGNSYSFGDNDPNIVACVGDSLTQGYACDGAPYPTILAEKTGKTVLNYGVGGTASDYGISVIGSVLQQKPGYVCLLFGSNDAIHGRNEAETKEYLRRTVQACKANQTVVIIGTVPPMTKGHRVFNGRATKISEVIRELAKEEGIPLVDLNKAFGDGEKYLNEDGLHLTDAGGELIASKFAGKL